MMSPRLQKGVSVLLRNVHIRQPRRFRLPEKGEVITHGERRYFIGERIGQGGFGVVFECSDEWGNALVAKILLPQERRYSEVRDSWLEETGKLLELRGDRLIRRAQRPVIMFLNDPARACGEERLDRQHEALPELRVVPRILDGLATFFGVAPT